jgi:hypothetical protein
MANCQRFSDISISERILNSLFLLSIGLGYLFSLGQVFFTHQGRDGQPGLSIADIAIAYHGSPEQTRLAAAINGPMAGNLKSAEDKAVILDWIDSGARQAIYQTQVAPILERDCQGCHSPASGLPVPALTSYEQVVKLTEADRGASIPSLVRISHIHLFGIAFILFFVGKLFVLCDMPVWLKRLTIGIPFISMLTDIFAWYLTRETPDFAYLLVLSGGLLGLSLNFQIGFSLYQMWMPSEWDRRIQVETMRILSLSRLWLLSFLEALRVGTDALVSFASNLWKHRQVQFMRDHCKRILSNFAISVKNRLPADWRLF